MAKSVFISYSSKDIMELKQITRMLNEAGITYWKAPEMIPAGSNYAREIPKAISECEVFLLIISEFSQDSIWVEKEIDCAINNRKTIVPIKLRDTELSDMFRFYLNNVQTISYSENPKIALEMVRERIKSLVKSVNQNQTTDHVQDKGNQGQSAKDQNGLQQNIQPELQSDLQNNIKNNKQNNIRNNRQNSGHNSMQNNVHQVAQQGYDLRNKGKQNVHMQAPVVPVEMQMEPARVSRANSLDVNQIPTECQKCGGDLKMVSRGTYQCVECGFLNYDSFQKIRNFLEKAGPQQITLISRATGVPRKTIEYFLKDERLEIPKGSPILLVCEGCGAGIRTGRLCARCKEKKVSLQNKKNEDSRYRFL